MQAELGETQARLDYLLRSSPAIIYCVRAAVPSQITFVSDNVSRILGHEPRQFIELHVGPEIELAATGEAGGNYKSLLQQFAQREFGNTPLYQLLDEKGPDHAKCFKISAVVGGQRYQAAWGRNKKEAEQRAACNALFELRSEPAPFPSD